MAIMIGNFVHELQMFRQLLRRRFQTLYAKFQTELQIDFLYCSFKKKMENTEIHKELVLIIEQVVASTNPEKKTGQRIVLLTQETADKYE